MAAAFPLQWPMGWPRTPRERRESGKLRTSYESAIKNVQQSLRGFAADSNKSVTDPVMSSNVDFMGQLKDSDPGVAIWFTWDNMQVCFAVDRYNSAASNLQAIHHIIEARRTELRHGTLHLVRQTFKGFLALPAPDGKHWTDILGVPTSASRQQITDAHKTRARAAHPDTGGSTDKMAELNTAKEAALQEVAT